MNDDQIRDFKRTVEQLEKRLNQVTLDTDALIAALNDTSNQVADLIRNLKWLRP